MSTLATETSPNRRRGAADKPAGHPKPKVQRTVKSDAPAVKTSPMSRASATEKRATKQKQVLALLSWPEGASIEDLMLATAWQQHSVRGFLAGTVKKKLGLALTSSKAAREARRYRIALRRGR